MVSDSTPGGAHAAPGKDAERPRSMIFYRRWRDYLGSIPDKGRRLAAYEAVMDYAFGGGEPADGETLFTVRLMLDRVDEDMARYMETKRKNDMKDRERGKRDGEGRG